MSLCHEEINGIIRIPPTDDVMIGDSWFGSVTTALGLKNLLPHPKHSITQVKTATLMYPKKFLDSVMKDWPGGSYLVLESVIDHVKMYAVGYKYSSRKNLCFLFTDGSTSTEPGVPYRARYIDKNGNSCIREIPRPECCST